MEYEFGDIILLMNNRKYTVICTDSNKEMEYYLLLDIEDSTKQILIKREKNNKENDEVIIMKDIEEIREVLNCMANS